MNPREREKVAEGLLIGTGYLIKELWQRLSGHLKNGCNMARVELGVRVRGGVWSRSKAVECGAEVGFTPRGEGLAASMICGLFRVAFSRPNCRPTVFLPRRLIRLGTLSYERFEP